MLPMAPGDSIGERFLNALKLVVRQPLRTIRTYLVPDWAKYNMILLHMRTVEGHIRMRLGRSWRTGFQRWAVTTKGDGPPAKAWSPEATDLAERVARLIDGYPTSLLTETVLGIPTTAHILGGCPMGDSPENGAIDHRHRLFGYEGLWVVDGSAISANPGVNPSLTITALAERAMTFIPEKAKASSTVAR
jgi:cholesterol oxidase